MLGRGEGIVSEVTQPYGGRAWGGQILNILGRGNRGGNARD